MHCRSCRSENSTLRRYCRGCGAPLVAACPHCRFANDPLDRFCGGCGRPLPPPSPGGAAGLEDFFPFGAERRQVTLIFVDLVGSTALSERLDPEDMSELYRAYREAAGAVIAAYGGYVAHFAGDGILAYSPFAVTAPRGKGRPSRSVLVSIAGKGSGRPEGGSRPGGP